MFLSVFQRKELAHGLRKEQNESPSMMRTVSNTGPRQRHISWGVLLSLVGYFLNLCTLSPLVHADTLRQLGLRQSAVPAHCQQSPSITFPAPPATADHHTTPEPLCCEFRGGHNKALARAVAQSDLLLLSPWFLVPFAAKNVVAEETFLHEVRALYSAHAPPLYLIHAAFLI